jgi:hypothetical protein
MSALKMTRQSRTSGAMEASANSLGHVETKEQEGDEVEERRPDDGNVG